MTDPDLDAIRARLEATASATPWINDGDHIRGPDGDIVAMEVWEDGDRDFIAHAPEDIRTLLAEVERLRDLEDSHRAVMAEECAGDEVHCSCVPALRAEVERLRGMLADERSMADLVTRNYERLQREAIERVGLNDDGTLDEIVGVGHFHLEQMDDDCWWLNLGGECLNLVVMPKHRRKVTAVAQGLPFEKWGVTDD